MQKNYEICGIGVYIESDDLYHFKSSAFNLFIQNNAKKDISLKIKLCKHQLKLPPDYLNINTTNFFYDSKINCFFQWDTSSVVKESNSCVSWMEANCDWTQVTIYSNSEYLAPYLESNFLLTAFQSKIACFNGILLHGAIVEHNKEGIVFVGSSGVGKSTHSELWAKYFGDRIINGDKTFLRIIENCIYAYGSAWSGSSGYVNNIRTPLCAIVVIEQSAENSIKKLSNFEALGLFTTHCYFPIWDKTLMCHSMNTLDEIINKIPIYLLKCRPEKDAAVLVRDAIFSNKNGLF